MIRTISLLLYPGFICNIELKLMYFDVLLTSLCLDKLLCDLLDLCDIVHNLVQQKRKAQLCITVRFA